MSVDPLPEEHEVDEELREERPPRWWVPALAVVVAAALLALAIPGLLPGRSVSSGTAFAVAEGLLVTAAHVVQATETATVYVEGRRYKGTVVARSTELDAAVVALPPGVGVVPLPLGDPLRLDWGEAVWALGFPGGEPWPTAVGSEVVGVGWSAVGGDGSILSGLVAVRAPFRPGFSGSPLLNGRGEVVGIVSGTLRGDGAGSLGFAVSASRVRSWLQGRGVGLLAPSLREDQLSQTELSGLARRSVFRIEVRR